MLRLTVKPIPFEAIILIRKDVSRGNPEESQMPSPTRTGHGPTPNICRFYTTKGGDMYSTKCKRFIREARAEPGANP